MTTNHTPGPWRRQVIAPTFVHTAIETANGKLAIARVYGRGANARLIAAAPDMLQALEGIYTDDDGDGYCSAEHMAVIREIIARIQGV